MTDDSRAAGTNRAGGVDDSNAGSTGSRRIVVVGGGLAGVRTCQELRGHGFSGELHLVRAEAGHPYDRPPLSKGRDGHRDADLAIDLDLLDLLDHPGSRAVGLRGTSVRHDDDSVNATSAQPEDATPLSVILNDGSELHADAVIAASGAHPIIPADWTLSPRVRVLRTREDAAKLWATLDAAGPGARIAVLGGSWIGLEFATAAVDAGFEVSVFERADRLLPMLPSEAGQAVERWCDEAGVAVHVGEHVEAVETADSNATTRIAVTTATTAENFDVVLIGLGVTPTTEWLAATGLTLGAHGALRVDAHLRTDDRRVIGVGDCSERWSPRYGTWLPGGHWQGARDEPVVAAASALAALTAGRSLGPAHDAVPYFWSEMFGHTLQFSGYIPAPRAARVISRGDLHQPSWTLAWLDDHDRLQALLACDRPRDAITARKALAAHPEGLPTVDPVLLADPAIPLAQSLRPAELPNPGER